MITRILKQGHYKLQDLHMGDVIETGSCLITSDLIDSFANLSGDQFEIHINESAAQAHGFSNRVAHGLLILSLIDGLKNQAPAQLSAIASLGWDWKFSAPVFVGDEVTATFTIIDLIKTSNLERGIVTLDIKVQNQQNKTVQHGINYLMIYL